MQNLELTLKQKLNISNKIITTLQIMTLNILELQSFLEKESEDNVFIDYDCFFEDKLFRNYIKNKVHKEKFVLEKEDIEDIEKDRYEPTLTEILLEQLGTFVLDEEEKNIGEIIIYSLDKDGYLRDNIDEIADITHQDVKKIKKILKIIQTFEPVGIGARNLQECLLLQTQDDFVKKIIKNYMEDIYKNNINKIAKNEKKDIEFVKNVLEYIKKLNPRPASGYKINKYETNYIYPDIILDIKGDYIKINIKENISNIHANEYYLKLLDTDIDDDTRQYLKKKLTRTMMIIEGIEKRKQTMEKIANIIIEKQKRHILYDEPLENLQVKDIANMLNISNSTVSRAIRHKYLQTPKHMYKLKNLLSLPSKSNSNNISKDYIMSKIRNIISLENKQKPLSDEKITDMLIQQDINIKRRTVAKYRDEMGIKIAKMRKLY